MHAGPGSGPLLAAAAAWDAVGGPAGIGGRGLFLVADGVDGSVLVWAVVDGDVAVTVGHGGVLTDTGGLTVTGGSTLSDSGTLTVGHGGTLTVSTGGTDAGALTVTDGGSVNDVGAATVNTGGAITLNGTSGLTIDAWHPDGQRRCKRDRQYRRHPAHPEWGHFDHRPQRGHHPRSGWFGRAPGACRHCLYRAGGTDARDGSRACQHSGDARSGGNLGESNPRST